MDLPSILAFIYFWAKNFTLEDCAKEAGISCSSTRTQWGIRCRSVCETWLNHQGGATIGGFKLGADGNLVAKVVEIDELGSNGGRVRPEKWVLGGIERETGNSILVEVPNRTRATLQETIQKYILPGTRILSGGWAAYGDIPKIGQGIYSHAVNPSGHFVDPNDSSVHAQGVKGL